MESKVATELDYKKTEVTYPSYQLSLITQQSGGNTVTLDASGGQQSIFELPAQNAFNLSKSFIDYDYTIPALVGAYSVAFMDCVAAIQQITYQTRTAVKMLDIPNFQQFTKVTMNTDTKFSDFITNDRKDLLCRNNTYSGIITPQPTVTSVTQTSATNVTTSTSTATGGALWGCGIRPSGANITTATNVVATCTTSSTTFATTNYTEPMYITTSKTTNQALTVNVRLNLGRIYNTILALDKDLYFNEVTQLVIYWAPYTNLGFTSTTLFVPTTSNPPFLALATAPTNGIQNLKMYLAVEQNQNIVNGLKAKIASGGLSTLVDYVYPQKTNFTATQTGQNLSIKYNRAHGRKLKRIYNAVFNASGLAAKSNTQFDHHNGGLIAEDYPIDQTAVDGTAEIKGGQIIANYYTMLDNTRLQQFNIDCTVFDDWMIHKDKLKDSVIQDALIYTYNWVHIESWDGMKTCEHDNNISSGLDLSFERKWDFVATTGTGFGVYSVNHFTFAVTEKELIVKPEGIICQ